MLYFFIGLWVFVFGVSLIVILGLIEFFYWTFCFITNTEHYDCLLFSNLCDIFEEFPGWFTTALSVCPFTFVLWPVSAVLFVVFLLKLYFIRRQRK